MGIIQRIADIFAGVRVPRLYNSYGIPNTPMSPSEPDVRPVSEGLVEPEVAYIEPPPSRDSPRDE